METKLIKFPWWSAVILFVPASLWASELHWSLRYADQELTPAQERRGEREFGFEELLGGRTVQLPQSRWVCEFETLHALARQGQPTVEAAKVRCSSDGWQTHLVSELACTRARRNRRQAVVLAEGLNLRAYQIVLECR